MQAKMIQYTNEAEKVIEMMGRICYQSGDKVKDINDSVNKFIRTIIKNGHHSVLEHASASFICSGVSRVLTHQLVRSRLAVYSQKSQRYCNEHAFEYIAPESISLDKAALACYDSLMKDIQRTYDILVTDFGINKEDARFVLPNACTTEIGVTMNFREFLHTIDLRVSIHAQWEIRELFIHIWKSLYEVAPNIFNMTYFEFWSKDQEYKKEVFESRIKGNK